MKVQVYFIAPRKIINTNISDLFVSKTLVIVSKHQQIIVQLLTDIIIIDKIIVKATNTVRKSFITTNHRRRVGNVYQCSRTDKKRCSSRHNTHAGWLLSKGVVMAKQGSDSWVSKVKQR